MLNTSKIVSGISNENDKKRPDEKIIVSEQKYRLFFKKINAAIILFDKETRKILDVNGKTIETFGYTRKELLKMNIETLALETFKTLESLEEIMKKKQKNIPVCWCQKKDGNPIPVSICSGSFECQGRNIIYCIINDIHYYLSENIRRVNLINKISQLNTDLSDFIKIFNANFLETSTSGFMKYGITEKEMQVINLIIKGLSNKEIAKKDCIAEITIKKRISSIFKKLKIKKRTELISFILNNKVRL